MLAQAVAGAFDNNSFGIICRKGHGMQTRAIIPDWGRVAIDDVCSLSAKGQRAFTVSAILGDLILVHSAAYQQVAFGTGI